MYLIEEQIKRKRRRKWYYTVSVTMAVIVFFCTVYALVLSAITLEKKNTVLDCPLNVHQHSSECYDEDGALICGQADFVIHTHSENCYNKENELVCTLPEISAHEHTDECYKIQQLLICTNKSGEPVPTDNSLTAEETLTGEEIPTGAEAPTNGETPTDVEMPTGKDPPTDGECGFPETAEHVHTDECYKTERELICRDTAILHKHDETCRDESGKLICGMLQVTEHYHTNECFKQVEKETETGLQSDAQSDIMLTANSKANWGYNPDGSIWWMQNGSKQTANRVSTASAPRTVINMFDYWVTDNRDDRDDVKASANGGINNGHAFKFSRGSELIDKLNVWVGGGQNPLQGIVNNQLSARGYPVLSGKYPVNGYDSTESLEYLFNPNVSSEGKSSYKNVGGLLSIDGDGYYSFDSKSHMAELNEENNSFNVYDRPAANSGFFPFNKAPQIMTSNKDNPEVNHYFGMTMTTRFIQMNGGHTNSQRNVDTVFEFSGDDDVWIFVDDVLVGDAGGIHDASSVSINFATGKISVKVNSGTRPLETTLYDQYEAAGKQDSVTWAINELGQKIFSDDTSHTLQFFYLERGNYDSNMRLKYNLTEIPVSSITKIDQYGNPVSGAKFAVYAANENYDMLDAKGGNIVPVSKDVTYDNSGNIINSSGGIIAHALYTGTTGADGMMIFSKDNGKLYSIDELNGVFGEHFILREIGLPDGYRTVNKDAYLQIWEGESQKIIRCNNTPCSGVRANASLQITATDELYLQRSYNGSNVVRYCNPDGSTTGTLFAVVFRYVGERNENGEMLDTSEEAWIPICGNDKTGYQQVPLDLETSGPTRSMIAALEAAKQSAKTNGINDVVFRRSSEGTMQLTKKNLPGHITTYYYMLATEDKAKAQYTVAYYWTDQDSLDSATPENTYRVYTFKEAVPDGTSFSAFERKFGADVQVPNLINRVFVQKVDENNNLINDATFAIYPVQQETNGDIYYTEKGEKILFPKEAVPNPANGYISVGEQTIKPMATGDTKTYEDGIHTGTTEFDNLPTGQYIIKEIKSPPGYKLNKSDIMVQIDEDTIYANAGTEEDGVTVGRGPGYLVTPLAQFASPGNIDNTLTWIYARMLITSPSTLFSDIGKEKKITGYLSENNSSKTTVNIDEAFKTYLIYDPKNDNTAFNYAPDPLRNINDPNAPSTDGYRRLFTTVGWNYYEIFQDYKYGLGQVKLNGAYYEDWSTEYVLDENGNPKTVDRNLMNLFSRSTYISVTDEWETNIRVKKVDNANHDILLADVQFRLYTLDESGEKLYYSWDATAETPLWLADAAQALTVTTGKNGIADKDFAGLKDGEYYLEEAKPPNGYYKLDEAIKLTVKEAKLTLISEKPTDRQIAEADGGASDENGLYIYTVTVYNSTGFELPATGGSGTTLYTIGGILLIALSLVFIYKEKGEKRIE